MEKVIIKTIREAFKKAYINKLLKESAGDMAAGMSPQELMTAEKMYNLWIGGRANPALGLSGVKSGGKKIKFGNEEKQFNYIVEKALEEYKQTHDDNLRSRIAQLFYPTKGSKTYNMTMDPNSKIPGAGTSYGNAIAQALRNRYGNSWQDFALEDVLMNAWYGAVAKPEAFDEIVAKYKVDSPSGFGGLVIAALKNKALSLAMKSQSKKRGGGSGGEDGESTIVSLGDTLPLKGGSREERSGESDDSGSDAIGALDRGSIDVVGDEGLPEKEDAAERMIDMFADFADEASQLPGLKETHTYLIDQFFKNRKSYEEILQQRPDLYPGKTVSDLSSTFINLVNNRLMPVAAKVGKRYGFPTDWLQKIMATKSLKHIEQLFKIIDPGELPGEKPEDDLIFEFNVEEIMQEVYKRIAAKNI